MSWYGWGKFFCGVVLIVSFAYGLYLGTNPNAQMAPGPQSLDASVQVACRNGWQYFTTQAPHAVQSSGWTLDRRQDGTNIRC